MGGIFSSPKPPAPPPPPPVPEPEPKESEADLAAKAARERRRRGQSEMIATSWRGLSEVAQSGAPRAGAPKRLIGE